MMLFFYPSSLRLLVKIMPKYLSMSPLYPRLIMLGGLLLFLGGCATSSLFNPYPKQAGKFRQAITTDQTSEVLSKLAAKQDNADFLLYMMERGRISQLANLFAESEKDFTLVGETFDEQDLAAQIQGSKFAAQGASLVTNDNAIPYEGSGYERIFTHHFQAYNYLGTHDIEGAGVELRKARLEQRILLEQHEKEVAAAHEKANKEKIDLATISANFSGMDTIAGRVKNSFQNGYTFYTSAAFWEAQDELNDALVDYKKAYEVNQDSVILPVDIARVSAKLGDRQQDISFHSCTDHEGVVVVLFEEGFVPAKQQIKFPVPTFDGGFIAIAFPYYNVNNWPSSQQLTIRASSGQKIGHTEEMVNVSTLAIKAFKENLSGLIVRQVLRGLAKYELQHKSEEHGGILGQIGASIYNYASENADLRSWLTLPNSGQAQRLYLPVGQQKIILQVGSMQKNITLDIKKKRTTLVRVVDVAPRLIVQVFPL